MAEEKHFRELVRKVIFLSGSREQRPPLKGEVGPQHWSHSYALYSFCVVLYILSLFLPRLFKMKLFRPVHIHVALTTERRCEIIPKQLASKEPVILQIINMMFAEY